MAHCYACIALLLLLIGPVSTVPDSDSAQRESSTAACKVQNTLSNRLDAMEKRVEDTVLKLEEEVVGLLDAIEGPEWNFVLNSNSAGPVVDILEDSSHNPRP